MTRMKTSFPVLPASYPFAVEANDPAKRGALAGRKITGEGSRFAVAPVHTRFDAVQWFVWDADVDEGDGPVVVRQAATYTEAVRGLS